MKKGTCTGGCLGFIFIYSILEFISEICFSIKKTEAAIVALLVLILCAVVYHAYNSIKKAENNKDSVDKTKKSSNKSKREPILSKHLQSRYEYFLSKYNETEKKVIEQADRKVTNAQMFMEDLPQESPKRLFLQSFVNYHKYNCIAKLIRFSSYPESEMTDELDPLFTKTAERIVASQEWTSISLILWNGCDYDKNKHLENQLIDNGILERNYNNEEEVINISDIELLHKMLNKMNGHSLLTKNDKLNLNKYFEQRKLSLIGDHALQGELNSTDTKLYNELDRAYGALASCDSKWEIVSSITYDGNIQKVNTIVERKKIISLYEDPFNYLPATDIQINAICFNFKQAGIRFYIYPEFVIAARSFTNFEVIDIKDFTIKFYKQNFHEVIKPDIPKDTRIIKYTNKIDYKDGCCDNRYTTNHRYAVCEYGDLTFLPYQLTMQFSNSLAAERFYKAFLSFQHKEEEFENNMDTIQVQIEKEEKEVEKSHLNNTEKKGSFQNPLEELKNLIGLSEVKNEVSALAKFVKIQQEREKKGMKPVSLSYHCIFTGNPGTGKTTVARILADIYRSLGVLKNGHLVETDRAGLVAEYVGQTAVKTNKIIDSALNGVLFIDEAYSLVQGGGNDYGHEAISTLLKRMEDDRNRFVVILAGYSEEMKKFIDSNPGLQSRFNRYIHFSDYTVEELKQIFLLNVNKNQYTLDKNALSQLSEILTYAIEHKDKNFGNGRFVRNLFEKTIQNQAIRLASNLNVTKQELATLLKDDLPQIEF